MRLVKTDIDELLEATSELAEDDCSYRLKIIEIDKLLETTQDW
ncbi:hypothetical protein SM124_00145 [Bacillus sp. 31A1R]|uniref:Uncharacterized protein n=1 Tax=Robertmurraya mangrovi TaxID=3098077 RepID=A0ABU5ISK7_9BACI|nr:hypothetical protein [Bacillus sp. 31A1R]MDZ5470145.1 hypothetical protein [Bacillus sp. 31A1R]